MGEHGSLLPPPEDAYWNKAAPGHDAAVKRVTAAFNAAYPEPVAPPAQQPTSGKKQMTWQEFKAQEFEARKLMSPEERQRASERARIREVLGKVGVALYDRDELIKRTPWLAEAVRRKEEFERENPGLAWDPKSGVRFARRGSPQWERAQEEFAREHPDHVWDGQRWVRQAEPQPGSSDVAAAAEQAIAAGRPLATGSTIATRNILQVGNNPEPVRGTENINTPTDQSVEKEN